MKVCSCLLVVRRAFTFPTHHQQKVQYFNALFAIMRNLNYLREKIPMCHWP